MNQTAYQRAFVQSAVGHVTVIAIALVATLITQCARPVLPEEMITNVAILAGPQADGEMGAPPLEAARPDNEPPAPTPPPAPAPDPTPIREPDPVPVREPDPPKIKEPDKPAEKIPEKLPDPPKKPDPPKPEPPKPEPPKPEPPKPDIKKPKEIVRSTNIVTRKIDTASTEKPKGPQKSALTDSQIKALMAAGLPPSRSGGAGFGGGPPGSIATGTPSSGAELYKAGLKVKLFNAWQRPAGVDGLLTVIRVSIGRSGEVISTSMTRRSGNPSMDNSALDAVRNCRPAPLPAGLQAPFVLDVEFDASGIGV